MVLIVEIPGPRKEAWIRQQDKELIIIDHHRYQDLDRSHPLSSLEQFTALFAHEACDFNRKENQKKYLIAVNDRDFIAGMHAAGASYQHMQAIRLEERQITETKELFDQAQLLN